MSAFLHVALPKMGYVRTASRDLVYAPTSLMGCGIKNLHVQQLIHHVSVLLDHCNSKSLTGHLISIVAEGFHMESGYGTRDPFQTDMTQLTWITHTWFTDTILSLNKYRLTLHHNLPLPEQWTTQDCFKDF